MASRRRWIRWISIVVAAFIALPALYVEVQSSGPDGAPLSAPPDSTYTIYVADWGYHTSIILQQPPSWSLGPSNNPAAHFVEFAWGNADFYMSESPSPLVAAKAALWPGKSVTYVRGWDAPPALRDGARRIVSRRVSATELQQLAQSLARTLDRQIEYPPVRGYPGRFYQSHARYLWSFDCNRWTVRQLAAAHLAGASFGVILSRQVFGRVNGFIDLP